MGLDTSKKMGQSNSSETLSMASPPPVLHSLEAAAAHEKVVVLSKRSTSTSTKVMPACEATVTESPAALQLSADMICPGIDHLRSGFQASRIKPAVSDHLYHVLAVDDSRFDRRVVEKLLKISSYKVTTVSSAVKALVVLGLSENCPSPTKDVDIDLIITDFCMPDMTGYDLLKRVKTSALRDIPVVIMSSENDPDRIRTCLSEGAEEFIIKPVQLSDVKRLKSHIHPVATSSPSHSSSGGTGESSGSTSGKRKAAESHDTPEVTSSDSRRPPHQLKQVRLINC